MSPTIRQVRALVARGGGGDYHDQGGGHWIDDHIATPMARYPEYRQSRQSFGINVLGTLVVEIGYAFLIWPRRTRSLWCFVTIGLHLGLGLFMGLVFFSSVMIVLTTCLWLIPEDALERAAA